MADIKNASELTPPSSGDKSGTRVDLWLFVLMLALALVGVGIAQRQESGGRYYWLFLVLIYAAIGIVRRWQRRKGEGQSLWSTIRAQVLHWLGSLVAIYIVLFFESVDISSRGEAADYSLLILALSCYLAGVHFHWAYLLIGAVLAVTAVGLGYLDQMSLFAVVVPLSVVAVWIFAKRAVGKGTGT